MSQAASDTSRAHAERILSFWHKVEFFVSPDLKELEEGASSAIKYSHEDLATRANCLPWLNREQLRRASTSHEPTKPYMFKLYLGVFPRSEIFRIARDYYPERAEGSEERNADEGQSCSMTVLVDEYGHIAPESFEFSTVPWALGAGRGHADAVGCHDHAGVRNGHPAVPGQADRDRDRGRQRQACS